MAIELCIQGIKGEEAIDREGDGELKILRVTSKMQQSRTTTEDDWNISGSEDEGDAQFGGRTAIKENQDLKKRRKKLNNNDGLQQMPLNVVMLYKEVERNGIIELTCKCPRRGPPKNDSQPQNSPQSSSGSITNKMDAYHATTGQTPSKQKIKSEYQGFDYKDEEERPFISKSSSAKKTPLSGKRAKKTASMTNVVNDLLRQKMLDDLENSSTDQKEERKKIKLDDKDSKVTVDFDTQESMTDLKDGIASQISKVETMLDSKEGKKTKAKEK